jgi:hypothetical protein
MIHLNLLQNWKNGTDYIFLESKDGVDELAPFLKANETEGLKSVHFFFPDDLDGASQISNHIAINVSRFADDFGRVSNEMRLVSIRSSVVLNVIPSSSWITTRRPWSRC